jgi:peptidoglycan/LPS O-acetylase OafA/YrhL
MILFSLYTLWAQQWDLFLFLAGMFLAELQLLLHDQSNEYYRESTTYNYLPKSIHRHLAAIMHTFTGGLILVAGHLLGFPSWNADVSPGYTTLIKYTPQAYNSTILVQRFWQSIGAFLFVLALCLSPAPSPSLSSPSPLLASSPSPSSPPSHSSPFLQRPFNTPFAQYLGRISFGLYITHYYVLGTLGARIFLYVPSSMATEKACAFVFAGVVNTFLCFWIADLFWRAVDVKSVRVGKWIAGRCFVC